MLWQYLLLTMGVFNVETKLQRRIFKSVNNMKTIAKPPNQLGRRLPGLRIRNEYPFHLQDSEETVQIRGGNDTNAHNCPYMAAVLINLKLWCAGAIVDQNWVLTAAHCLNYVLRVSPSKSLNKHVKVRVGSSKAHEGGSLIDVVGAITHPKYELEPVPHADVALLKLANSLEFHKFVNLIPMYEGTSEPFAQSFVEVSGWGATRAFESSFHEHSPDMLTARLKVRPDRYCADSYQLVDAFQFTSDFFCASLRNGTRDACLFDAGAPAVQNDQLMGLMSFGPDKCGHIFQPAVFIKTFYFRHFVEKTIAYYKSANDAKPVRGVMEEVESETEPKEDEEYGNAHIFLVSNEESKERFIEVN